MRLPLVISGTPGSGTGALVFHLLRAFPALRQVKEHTDCHKEAKEHLGLQSGGNTHFLYVRTEEFRALEQRNFFIETAEASGFRYGLSFQQIRKAQEEGIPLVELQFRSIEKARRELGEFNKLFLLRSGEQVRTLLTEDCPQNRELFEATVSHAEQLAGSVRGVFSKDQIVEVESMQQMLRTVEEKVRSLYSFGL